MLSEPDNRESTSVSHCRAIEPKRAPVKVIPGSQRTDRVTARRGAGPSETRGASPAAPADPMRDFYDRHPYPPPTTDLERYRRQWQDPQRRRADYHLLWPRHPYREEQTILVAGCGTSQAAKYAIRRAAARVTGIDISGAGLDHTRRLQRRHGLTNLELHELPIERVHELGRSFDRIVCTGVLHHLADPDVGLRALRTVLEPDGALHLMVYAPYGRAGIYMIQEYCRRLGVGGNHAEILDLAAVLGMLPRDHPLSHVLRASPDFEHPHGLADALLNPRDRAYSVPQLFDFIERNGLSFGRWYLQAPYLPRCGDVAKTPHGPRLARLPAPEACAAVELLRGTLMRPQRHRVSGRPSKPSLVGPFRRRRLAHGRAAATASHSLPPRTAAAWRCRGLAQPEALLSGPRPSDRTGRDSSVQCDRRTPHGRRDRAPRLAGPGRARSAPAGEDVLRASLVV